MKTEIEKILKQNIGTINSFVDGKGKNHFPIVVRELEVLFSNRIWEIAAGILKSIGVKRIKTTYRKK